VVEEEEEEDGRRGAPVTGVAVAVAPGGGVGKSERRFSLPSSFWFFLEWIRPGCCWPHKESEGRQAEVDQWEGQRSTCMRWVISGRRGPKTYAEVASGL
jgi:hypothetical protein